MVNFYSHLFRKWPVAVKSFKEHVNTKSGMHSVLKNVFNRFLDHYKCREVPANKMVDSNYQKNVKKVRGNGSYS